jgi:hypothetical protein
VIAITNGSFITRLSLLGVSSGDPSLGGAAYAYI